MKMAEDKTPRDTAAPKGPAPYVSARGPGRGAVCDMIDCAAQKLTER